MALKDVQAALQKTRYRVIAWTRTLKFGQAALNLLALPILAPTFMLGWLFYIIKYFVGLAVFGFKKGARIENK